LHVIPDEGLQRLAPRPTITDVARQAGVSIATVDRVLNGRERVREETARLVYEAARKLGYHAVAAIERRLKSEQPEVRFGVVLHKQGQDFYKAFAEELHRAVAGAQGIQGRLVLEFSSSQAPSDMAAMLRSMAGRCDVLAATAVNHPEVSAAVDDLRQGGLGVYSLLSDFAQGARTGYVGLDNLKVGRAAAWMMTLAARGPGKVAIFVGGHRWHGHELREIGFRAYMRESAPDLEVMDPLVNLETRQLTYETTLGLLARKPDLRGVYVAGGGMEGAIAAMREARDNRDVSLVVSALTGESRAGLAEGHVTMVIDTPLEKLCRELIAQMSRDARGPHAGTEAYQLFLPPDIHLPESV
jgi:LacI family transcriptional regulator